MTAPSQTAPVSFATTLQGISPSHVTISRPAEVLNYLERYPDLADLLPLVCLKARQEFGEEAELVLQVYRDPEIDDRYLTLYIRQPTYDRQVMERIERVRAHYRDGLADKSGWLHVTTDFRSPGSKHGF